MDSVKRITSKENELIKHVKKLKDKKQRDLSNEYIIEGIKLIEEAIREKASIKYIIICEECEKSDYIPKELMYDIARYECIYVTSNIFKHITEVNNPQGILAVIDKTIDKENISLDEDIIVVLDDVQDPGNLGTILRTIDSIGLKQVVISKDTADPYNPKVVRSTMGAIFRINIIRCENLEEKMQFLKKNNYQLVVSSLQTQNSIYDINYDKKIIVIGNEGNGVRQSIYKLADEKVKIPMLGNTESLNASVATGIILYEYVRQKINIK